MSDAFYQDNKTPGGSLVDVNSTLQANGRNLNSALELLIAALGALFIPRSIGSVTLGAAATTVVANTNVIATSRVIPIPTNAAAATLMGSTRSLYVSARSSGVSFTLATASGVAAAGTETFDYVIINPV